ncbi:MAG: hypothetical protein ABSC36_04565 [Gaiellaceae bacterium]
MASDLEQQLVQLDELLGLLDAKALRGAQEALENQIAELGERLEVTRQALAQAQAQRKRLARARLLLDESTQENGTNGDPALHYKEPATEPTAEPTVEATVEATAEPVDTQPRTTAPFVTERRASSERRANGERRQVEDRRSET